MTSRADEFLRGITVSLANTREKGIAGGASESQEQPRRRKGSGDRLRLALPVRSIPWLLLANDGDFDPLPLIQLFLGGDDDAQ